MLLFLIVFAFFTVSHLNRTVTCLINDKPYIIIIVIMKLMYFRWVQLNRMMITWIGGTKRLDFPGGIEQYGDVSLTEIVLVLGIKSYGPVIKCIKILWWWRCDSRDRWYGD